MESENTNGVIRFGVFEVNLRVGELRRQGVKVKLQDQPFQVLAILLERPGELVTREELRDRMWPAGIFVDYEKSISKAVNKIREALGDSSENPRFIETLPRRGYRFLVGVEAGQVVKPIPLTSSDLPAELKPVASSSVWQQRVVGILATLALAIAVPTGIWISVNRALREPGPSGLIAVPLTTYPGHQSLPGLSPDGNQVAFVWEGPEQDNADIYVKLIGTENLLRLTNDPANDYAPAWSPDGRYIAFLRDLPDKKAAVLLVPSLGGPPERRLTETAAVNDGRVGGAYPGLSWSADGKWLAIKDRQVGESQDSVFLLSVETGEKRRLTHPPPGCGDGTPAFSPDGKRVAFSRTFTFGVSEVYVLDLSKGQTVRGPRQISFRKQWTSGLAWTRNGREIVFASGSGLPGGAVALWRVSASGSGEPHLLALAGEHGRWPAISRRGDRLAFVRNYSNDENIWRLNLSGQNAKASKAVKLIASTRNDYVPQYSPDGKRIVFISQRTGGDEVWVCNSDGSAPVQLTSLGAAITGCPRWSPDGARIVFDSNAVGTFDVYVVDASGGQPKRLTDHPADDAVASWSKDGRSIYFVSNRTKSWEVWKMPANGGTATQVTRNGGYVAFESVDGEFIYYAKRLEEGKLWRMRVRGGEETEVLDNIEGSSYSVLDNGIYFIRQPGGGVSPVLQFLEFATSKIQHIASIPHLAVSRGLSVPPDGRYALYTQEDQVPGSDLMLVENFR